jgi:hypothetical protein
MKTLLRDFISGMMLLALSLSIRASESWTNWTWANIGLSIPKTNFVVGEKIPASIILSNADDRQHFIFHDSSDLSSCGFGWFSIVEVSSGKKADYSLVPSGRGSMRLIAGHKSESFDFDLAAGYPITNAGLYNVQAVGWFPINEPPTNAANVTKATQPIIILLSQKPKTNAPPK